MTASCLKLTACPGGNAQSALICWQVPAASDTRHLSPDDTRRNQVCSLYYGGDAMMVLPILPIAHVYTIA